MNKYFSGLIKILSKRSKKTKDELKVSEFERMRAIENNDLKLNADIQAKLQEAEMQKQIIGEKAYEDVLKKAELEKYVVDIILIFNPEKDENVIKGCLKKVISKNMTNNEITKEEILQMVLKELNKKKTKVPKGYLFKHVIISQNNIFTKIHDFGIIVYRIFYKAFFIANLISQKCFFVHFYKKCTLFSSQKRPFYKGLRNSYIFYRLKVHFIF